MLYQRMPALLVEEGFATLNSDNSTTREKAWITRHGKKGGCLHLLFADAFPSDFRLMEEEGMIPPDSVGKYRKDPALLEADTRKGTYFMFVAIANAAGFL